jgi:hypothetical protein
VAIPDAQLDTWTALGSVPQSSATYESINNVLDSQSAPYYGKGLGDGKGFDIFLQGSYRNHTNVFGDSDVDVVICQTKMFYYNLDALTEPEKAEFKRIHPKPAQYTLAAFKADVSTWLAKQYETDFDPSGSKALCIKERHNRRNADVLVAARHKRYTAFPNLQGEQAAEGITFFTKDGGQIVNYPKQHRLNLTARHTETKEWLKPTVRIFKRMRNKMIADKLLGEGVAPSYYLEGLLYNAPLEAFGTSWQATVRNCLQWAQDVEKSALWCANGQHHLVRDGQKTSWSTADCQTFIDASVKLWNEWGKLKWI